MKRDLKKIEELCNSDIKARAIKAFEEAYPDAPDRYIEMAVFHSCIKGIPACLEWLEHLEEFLEKPNKGIDFGKLYMVMHHFYNLTVFDKLSKSCSLEMIDILETLKSSYEDKNMEHIGACIEELENLMLSRSRVHPEINFSE